MVDIKIGLLLVVAIVNVLIGLVVLLKKRGDPARLTFVVFTIGISLWAFTNALFQLTSDSTTAVVYALLSYYAGVMIAVPFFSFATHFPKPLPRLQALQLRNRLTIYTIVWVSVITIPNLTLRDVLFSPNPTITTGPGLWFHFISILLLISGGMVRLWRKRKHAAPIERRQLDLILFGAVFAAVAGIEFNLILPLLGNYSLVWLGPDFSLILVVFMGYAIVKHNLFNIRILATELFTAALVLVLTIELLNAKNWSEFMIRLLLFIFLLFIAWQLLKSVYQINRLNTELQELLKMKTDFLQMASHQMRTPLTAIRGMLTMWYEGDYDHDPVDKQKQVQKNVLISVERLNTVVNDLLQAAELEHGMTGELKPDNVAALVEQCIQTLQPNFEQKQITLLYQPPVGDLPLVNMRADYLQQVFMNLIDNAWHYTPAHGQVVIKLSQQDNQIVFTIQDSGIGIQPAEIDKIFDRFYRADHAKSMRPQGTGLGLFIVKKIITEHGGQITAASTGQYQGTLFTVNLPIS